MRYVQIHNEILKHASDNKNCLEENAGRWAELRGSDGVWGRGGEAQWLQHLPDLYVHSRVLYGGGNLTKQSVLYLESDQT